MWISAFFSNRGSPVSGLSPLIRIRDISNNVLIVTDVSMGEVGDGFYKYYFTSFNIDDDYVIRCDAGTTLSGADRYTFGSSGEYNDDFSSFDATLSGINITTSAVDSRLPLSPAFVDEYTATLSGIQADLDSPDQYKANILGLAQAGEYDVTLSGIQAEVVGLDGEPMRGTDGVYTGIPPTVSGINAELTASHGAGAWITGSGLSGQDLHDGLDGYNNKDDYKATGFAVSGEYDATLSGIQTDLNKLEEYTFRSLGLTQENQYIDNTVYANDNMISARLRIYSVSGSVGTDNDVIATYTITATYSGSDMLTYSMVKV